MNENTIDLTGLPIKAVREVSEHLLDYFGREVDRLGTALENLDDVDTKPGEYPYLELTARRDIYRRIVHNILDYRRANKLV